MKKRIIMILAVCASFTVIILVVRNFSLSDIFEVLGPTRANAINEIGTVHIKYADTLSCIRCHPAIDSTKNRSAHSKFNCQICHGSGIKHIADPAKNKMEEPAGRQFCLKCHLKDTSRLVCIMQVDAAKHNPKSNCTKCHNSHCPAIKTAATDPKDTLTSVNSSTMSCSLCHSDKNTLKSAGTHKNLLCQSCHGANENHMKEPAANKMIKPVGNAFCNNCHGIGITSSTNGIKQIDLKEHNPDSKCIDCHNSHNPLSGF